MKGYMNVLDAMGMVAKKVRDFNPRLIAGDTVCTIWPSVVPLGCASASPRIGAVVHVPTHDVVRAWTDNVKREKVATRRNFSARRDTTRSSFTSPCPTKAAILLPTAFTVHP